MKNIWIFALAAAVFVIGGALLGLTHLGELFFEWFGDGGILVLMGCIAVLFIVGMPYTILRKTALQSCWWFTLITSVTLAAVAGIACFIIGQIYWKCFNIPIGLGGGLFFIPIIPSAFVLSIPYAILVKWILNRQGIIVGLSQFGIAIGAGAFAIVLILAIFFPCEVQPGFVGGYLIKHWFGGR